MPLELWARAQHAILAIAVEGAMPSCGRDGKGEASTMNLDERAKRRMVAGVAPPGVASRRRSASPCPPHQCYHAVA
jgi:hypothetical protein